jgi:hypothetical protein
MGARHETGTSERIILERGGASKNSKKVYLNGISAPIISLYTLYTLEALGFGWLILRIRHGLATVSKELDTTGVKCLFGSFFDFV